MDKKEELRAKLIKHLEMRVDAEIETFRWKWQTLINDRIGRLSLEDLRREDANRKRIKASLNQHRLWKRLNKREERDQQRIEHRKKVKKTKKHHKGGHKNMTYYERQK